MCFPTQLQHSGTLALVDILHSGFPHRLPLRPVGDRLRTVLGLLVQRRLQELEQKMQQLSAEREQVQSPAAAASALENELREQRRIYESLRHWNPATARDRTLGKSHIRER